MQSCSLTKDTLCIGPVVISFSFSLFVLRRIQSHILSNNMLDECQSLDECQMYCNDTIFNKIIQSFKTF